MVRFLRLELVVSYFKINVARVLAFRASLFIELLWGFGYTVSMFVFWKLIYQKIPIIAWWTESDMLIFMFYLEIFWGLSRGLFGITRSFWSVINQGTLDRFLCRPPDPRVSIILATMQLTILFRSLPLGLFWLFAAIQVGYSLQPLLLGAGVIALIIGVAIYVEFALTINYLSFIWGNTSALDEILGGFWEILRYPLDILPWFISKFFTFLVPAFLAATLPAQIATGHVNALEMLGLCFVILLLWHPLQELAWRRGLKRYESAGG